MIAKEEKESRQEELEVRQSRRCCLCIYLFLSDFDGFTCQRTVMRTYPLDKKVQIKHFYHFVCTCRDFLSCFMGFCLVLSRHVCLSFCVEMDVAPLLPAATNKVTYLRTYKDLLKRCKQCSRVACVGLKVQNQGGNKEFIQRRDPTL